jgi:serine-type D-Ala-D-Ala carboxypeptidase (penicillin-binding protein 5/6)
VAALLLLLALVGPATAVAAEAPPHVSARAWTLIDARTGDVLTSHAAARRLPIASTTKLMTAYVALHELPPAKIVRAAPYQPIYGESLLGLRTGQRVSVRDLLYGLILRSGNDAAYDLALAAADSESAFVREMNLRAAALGLSDTHYANPIGLDQRGNYSSAHDLAVLTQHLLRIPLFAKIAATRNIELHSLRPKREIATINELLQMAPWINGVKTGHTFDAGYVLVGSGRRKGVELISVAIGAPTDEDRYLDNLDLLGYGFSLFHRWVPIHAGQDLADPSIRYAGGELPLRAARTVAVGLRHGQRLSVATRAPEEVEGPVRRGAVLGRAQVFVDGLPVADVPLRAGRTLPEAGLFDRVRSFVADNPILLGAVAFVILIGTVLLRRRLRRRREEENPIHVNPRRGEA